MLFYAYNIILYTWDVCVQVPLDGDWTFSIELGGATNGLIIPYGVLERLLRDRPHFLGFLSKDTGARVGLGEGLRPHSYFRIRTQNPFFHGRCRKVSKDYQA